MNGTMRPTGPAGSEASPPHPGTTASLTVGQQAALARVGCALERPGAVAVLCGPAGTGTTTVLGHLETIAARSCRVARTSLREWHGGVLEHAPDLLLVDDAHEASGDALGRCVRLAWSRQPASRLVLAGRGRLFTLLARDVDIEARVTMRATLHPFTEVETAALLATTCAAAGTPSDVLAGVVATIHEIAGGIPAAVVHLARVALVIHAANPTRRPTPDDIETVHRRVSLEAA